MGIVDVRFEHHHHPLGIGEAAPRVSWQVSAGTPGWFQTAYEIRALHPDGTVAWTSGRIDDDESHLVAWPGPPLASRQRAAVQVRAWGTAGDTGWSAAYPVEAGLLRPEDWTADLIEPGWDPEPESVPAFRRAFTVRGPVRRARLYATAHGVYELWLGGVPFGDLVLAPGWTSYHHRLRYQTYDVTDALHSGDNAIGALVAEGWYRGRLGFGGGRRDIWGDRTGLLVQLEIEYTDGTSETVRTDAAWRCAPSGIHASIYDGQTQDARADHPGWAAAGFDDSTWHLVRAGALDASPLVAPDGPPVRRTGEVQPVGIHTSPSGRTIVDFGQNLVGRLRIRPRGAAGTEIVLRHAEVLEDGELCVRPLRICKAEDRFILRGTGDVEEWEPAFTFHGFRYAEVQGWPGELRPEDVTAVVCHSDMRRTGWFSCSEPLLDRLHENVVWSMRGNFLDVPTDCPQRDERLGWTGDLQVFAPTAAYLYDCAGVLASWLRDLQADQLSTPDRIPPLVVPDILGWPHAMAAWGDAVTIAPWVLYERYGDLELLRRQYEGMTAWVDHVAKLAGPDLVWDRQLQLGDWLDPTAPPAAPADSRTDGSLVATAYFARSARIVSTVAGLLGRADDARRYGELADSVREAFGREFVTPSGRVASDSQTAYALALRFDLLPGAPQRERAGARLTELVHMRGYRIGTGFVGTPLLADALDDLGQTQVAYRLLLETGCPSFLYPITMGATTTWERWDSMLPDGSVNPGEMTSFNHYALGAIADWLHRTVAGLAPAAPGYRRLLIRPRPGGGLTRAEARHETPYGMAAAGWSIADGELTVRVVVPPNTTAVLEPPGGEPMPLAAGEHTVTLPYQPEPYPPVRPPHTIPPEAPS
ncbi:alpha-L-rhamnosidase [Phytohabitans rumicis]|uniref:alpha-L-rhamnosidase n=1 Tax=Phytohabitans rumicis TaxID=1076125 RepID=A0A6V8LIZ8_9ACTN|nr:alpha-L-rhamnosidase [Phytohabitans rumicis]GFJ92605.1 alpha-L-rhamnosidase [Phytohabitans rumicis]